LYNIINNLLPLLYLLFIVIFYLNISTAADTSSLCRFLRDFFILPSY